MCGHQGWSNFQSFDSVPIVHMCVPETCTCVEISNFLFVTSCKQPTELELHCTEHCLAIRMFINGGKSTDMFMHFRGHILKSLLAIVMLTVTIPRVPAHAPAHTILNLLAFCLVYVLYCLNSNLHYTYAHTFTSYPSCPNWFFFFGLVCLHTHKQTNKNQTYGDVTYCTCVLGLHGRGVSWR